MTVTRTLRLASASPRRAELLRGLGVRFDTVVPDVDERRLPGEQAADHVLRLAILKARTALAPDVVVIAADTEVVIDDEVLGKPVDDDDARRILRALSGRTHEVITGLAIATAHDTGPGADIHATTETTRVTFAELRDADIDWYVATGEPHDKAGAYGIQGRGGLFVERIDGNYHNVVGLPLGRLRSLLADWDLDLLAWADA